MLKKIAWTSVLARDISKCNHWTRKHYCWRTLVKRKYPQRNEPAVVCPVRQASVVLLETDTRHMLAWHFQARAKLYLVPSPLQNPLLRYVRSYRSYLSSRGRGIYKIIIRHKMRYKQMLPAHYTSVNNLDTHPYMPVERVPLKRL